MGIFSFFKKKYKPQESEDFIDEVIQIVPHIDDREHLLKIAAILSDHQELVVEEVRKALFHTAEYVEQHQESCENRGIDSHMVEETPALARWLLLVDILMGRKFVCQELDYKAELGDFYFFFKDTYWFKRLALSFDGTNLRENDTIPLWCGLLDQQWKEKGVLIACLDMDSDSYVIVPVRQGDFIALQQHARQAGRHIKAAKDA